MNKLLIKVFYTFYYTRHKISCFWASSSLSAAIREARRTANLEISKELGKRFIGNLTTTAQERFTKESLPPLQRLDTHTGLQQAKEKVIKQPEKPAEYSEALDKQDI